MADIYAWYILAHTSTFDDIEALHLNLIAIFSSRVIITRFHRNLMRRPIDEIDEIALVKILKGQSNMYIYI